MNFRPLLAFLLLASALPATAQELEPRRWSHLPMDTNLIGTGYAYTSADILQGHVIYSIRPGLWTSASVGYAYGGISTVNGIEKNDRKENLAWALSIGCPITPHFAMKLAYIGTQTQTDTGADSNTIALGAVYVW